MILVIREVINLTGITWPGWLRLPPCHSTSEESELSVRSAESLRLIDNHAMGVDGPPMARPARRSPSVRLSKPFRR